MNAKAALSLIVALLAVAGLDPGAAGAGGPSRVPQTKITSVRADDPPGTARLSFKGGGGGGGLHFECSLDGRPFRACSSPRTYRGLAAGRHRFRVRAVTGGAPDPTPASRKFVISAPAGNNPAPPGNNSPAPTGDTTPPTTTIDSGPTGAIAENRPAFTFHADEPASFECSTASGAASFSPCASPYQPAVALAEGAHTFSVRARDGAGNVGSPATREFIVDTQPPVVTITVGPNGATSDPTPTFSFESSEPGPQECRVGLQGSPPPSFAPCDENFTPSPSLGDGAYAFEVRATDAAGNVGSDSRGFTVDTTPPVVTIGASPSSTNDTTPSFTFTVSDGTAQCKIDSGSFSACVSPFTSSTLGEGPHTFTVQATDAAGNVGSDSRGFTVDTTPPVVTIGASPSSTNDTTPSFSFTVSDGAVQCKIDSGSFSACVSPFTSSALSDGAHTVTVQATDAAGNVGSDSRGFTVDTTPPVVTIGASPSSTNDTTPSFTFTASDGTVECKIDSGSFGACQSPFTSSALGEGPHTFTVQATDAAGNVGSDSRGFTVDTTAPTVTFDSGPPASTSSTSAEFTFHASEQASFTCSLNGGAFAPCTSPVTVNGNRGVTNQFTARATDLAGNVGQHIYTWTID